MQTSRSKTAWWLIATSLALTGLAFYPTLLWLAMTWRGSSYYGHGFFVPLISAFLAWRIARRADIHETGQRDAPRSFAVGTLGIAIGLGTHLLALARKAYLLSSLALILVLAASALALAGPRTLRRQAFPLAFLLLMLPLPWLEAATPPLARWVTAAAARMAQALGLQVIADGARLELPGGTLAVGTPCSGMNSLVALLTLAVLYAFLVQGPWVARSAIVALALPIALLANLIRICLLIILAYYVGEEVALRYFHDWSGFMLFAISVMLLLALGKCLRCDRIRSDI